MQWRFSSPHMVILLAGACRADAQHMEKERKLYFNNKIKAGNFRNHWSKYIPEYALWVISASKKKKKKKDNPTNPPCSLWKWFALWRELCCQSPAALQKCIHGEKPECRLCFCFSQLKMYGTQILFSIQNKFNLHLGILLNGHKKDSFSGNITSSLLSPWNWQLHLIAKIEFPANNKLQ